MYVYKHNYSPEYSPILATYQNTKLRTNTLIGQSQAAFCSAPIPHFIALLIAACGGTLQTVVECHRGDSAGYAIPGMVVNRPV